MPDMYLPYDQETPGEDQTADDVLDQLLLDNQDDDPAFMEWLFGPMDA